jgi:hypothetical protein
MKFVPFTRVNHHLQSIFLGAMADEKIESYVWLFQIFLKAMGQVPPHLIITYEDASMKVSIAQVLPTTIHRFCMWHIMDKVPEKVGPSIREDEEFWVRFGKCVWAPRILMSLCLNGMLSDKIWAHENEWFSTKFDMRHSWIPAYLMDVPLARILRTTS